LGPSRDIGPAMTAKISKGNRQYQHRTTLPGLTEDKIEDPDEIKAQQEFDAEIKRRLGPRAKIEGFNDEPDNDLYEDDKQGPDVA
jgi:hypothetical protein